MKNNLADLNNILFEQLERLQDDELCCDEETAEREIKKTEAIGKIAEQVIEIGALQLKALSLQNEWGIQKGNMPELLENKKNAKMGTSNS